MVYTRPFRVLLILASAAGYPVARAIDGHTGSEPAWRASRGPSFDRRVVDVAEAGDARSESTHGYAGHEASSGVAGGAPYRQARGWMRYALATFDDTEVTVACTFVAPDGVAEGAADESAAGRAVNGPRAYDVVVEDSVVATRTVSASAAAPVVVEIPVPFVLTKGKTNIAVVIRARGGPTPALRQIRTIQDHNEVDHLAVVDSAVTQRLHSFGAP